MSKFLKGLSVLLVVAGIMVAFFPEISDCYYRVKNHDIILSYARKPQNEMEKYYSAALEYNKEIEDYPVSVNLFSFHPELEEQYSMLLDIDGIMGFLTIPDIDVQLPIYHGNDKNALDKGVSHMQSSSLPVGGETSHCVLSAHSGLDSAKMFNRLPDLKIGNKFYVDVAGKRLTYEVCQLKVVLPSDVKYIQKEKRKDYCTLITCTPYGVNTHRLLVRGVRVDDGTDLTNTENVESISYMPLIKVGLVILIAVILMILFFKKYGSKNV